ncbi:hypothetical protein RV11_GL002837 [Enterococcus phoeniculicola]|nr:hypothetical protein RV11_GL002837 [Enterococcus phoeniculicola]
MLSEELKNGKTRKWIGKSSFQSVKLPTIRNTIEASFAGSFKEN